MRYAFDEIGAVCDIWERGGVGGVLNVAWALNFGLGSPNAGQGKLLQLD